MSDQTIKGLVADDSHVIPMFATSEECEQYQRSQESRRTEDILDAHHRRTLEIMTRPPRVILSREGLYVGIL